MDFVNFDNHPACTTEQSCILKTMKHIEFMALDIDFESNAPISRHLQQHFQVLWLYSNDELLIGGIYLRHGTISQLFQ